MSLDNFLAEQSLEGSHDSEGVFTLDLSKASDRLTQFKLPSPHHYLLKVLQLASALGANEIVFRMERYRTSVFFRAPESGAVADSEAIYQAFSDPLNVSNPLLNDLVTALIGSLTEEACEVLWSYSEGHRGRRVLIRDHQFEARDFILKKPLEKGEFPCAYTMSVLHPKTWRFWLCSRRIADALKVVESASGFSRVRIKLDGRTLNNAPSNSFITHRRRRGPYGSTTYQAYRIASYRLCETGGFKIQRPRAANYVVRERDLNVWASATRLRNTLRPDGHSSPAWVLQFRDKTGNLNLRQVSRIPNCRSLLAFSPVEVRAEVPLRLTIVRNSVVVLSEEVPQWSDRLPFLKGCAVIIHDEDLHTDLTGFQLIQDAEFEEKLRGLEGQVNAAQAYLERAGKVIKFLD